MAYHDTDHVRFYDEIRDAKDEGYTPIRAWSVLQFFKLRGKTSVLSKENLEPIPYLYYLLRSPQENRYYKRLYHPYPVDTIYFYRRHDTFSGEDEAVSNLRKYVEDGNITIIYTPPQIEEIKSMLARVWKANVKKEGTLSYRDYVDILKVSLDFEDYKDYAKSLTGFATVCKKYQTELNAMWIKVSTQI